jgi:hypothetical protein
MQRWTRKERAQTQGEKKESATGARKLLQDAIPTSQKGTGVISTGGISKKGEKGKLGKECAGKAPLGSKKRAAVEVQKAAPEGGCAPFPLPPRRTSHRRTCARCR